MMSLREALYLYFNKFADPDKNWIVIDISEKKRPTMDFGGKLDPRGSVDGSFREHR